MSDFLIADDLSGALDAAAAFHDAGRRVTIVLSPKTWPRAVEGKRNRCADNRDTQRISGRRRCRSHAGDRVGCASGGRLLYKKIDSTLRGPVAAELAALTSALPGSRVLFLPANPAVGRTVRDGSLLVHGVPVAATEFGRDPVSPVTKSSIRDFSGPPPRSE